MGLARFAIRLALIACAVPLSAQNVQAVAFVNGRWFDGASFVQETVYANDGVLTRHRPASLDTTVDLRGRWVVPPYGEAHNHNVEGSRAAEVSRGYLAAGILYVKNPNSLPRARERLADAVNTPTSIDVVFAGGGLTTSDGHPWDLVRRNIARGIWQEADAEGAFVHSIDDLAALEEKWPTIVAQDPDFIKTYLLYSEEFNLRSGDSAYFSWSGLHPDVLAAIVLKAHPAGKRVSTHVETAIDFRHAVQAGVDEINHLPGFRPDRDRLDGWQASRYAIAADDARAAARKGIVVVTTVGTTLNYLASERAAAVPRDIAGAWRDVIVSNLRLLKESGVRIAIGTDNYGSTDGREALALLDTGVFTPRELLRMWTEITSATIFPERKIGRLADGYEASFLVLDGNPLNDFANTGRIVMCVKQGRTLP